MAGHTPSCSDEPTNRRGVRKEYDMDDKQRQRGNPKPERLDALKNLPSEIMRCLTKEEINAFLFDEVWPDSLGEKLKDYLVKEQP